MSEVTEAPTKYFIRVGIRGREKPFFYSANEDEVDRIIQESVTEDRVLILDDYSGSAFFAPIDSISYVQIDEHDNQ